MQVIFASGTSAVGKSEWLATLPDTVKKCTLSARVARERLGNPSWDSLIVNLDLAMEHQKAVLHDFLSTIDRVIGNAACGDTIVFDRHPVDVLGYSVAYGIISNLMATQISTFFAGRDYATFQRYVFRRDPTRDYVQIPERPPYRIRQTAGDFLESIDDKNFPNHLPTKVYGIDVVL